MNIKKDCKFYGTDECKSKDMYLIICEHCEKYKREVCPECGDRGYVNKSGYKEEKKLPESTRPIFIKIKDGNTGLHNFISLYKDQFYLCINRSLWMKSQIFFSTPELIDSEIWALMKGTFEENGIYIDRELRSYR